MGVNEGKVRGAKKVSKFSGAEYYSFFGIPYGQNTRGSMRLKDPVKAKPWDGILDASVEKKEGCLQYSYVRQNIVGSEDCLYTNIHTPNLPSKNDALKAVIVLLHPGGLSHGSPETWHYGSPDYIMHLDVLYVGIAHRLHFLGFLNLGLDECSGNQGLKDIILGLEWIRDNISVFGGDPNNVTLLGSSSGAALVHNMMLSHRAQGLFHKAVMMSGYFFNPLRLTMAENMTMSAELAENLEYDVPDKSDRKKLLSIYRKIGAEHLIAYRPDRKINMVLGTPFPVSPFMPTVDHRENGVHPHHFRKSIPSTARVPLLYGICEKEAFGAFCRGMREGTMKNFVTSIRNNHYGWAYDVTDDEVQYIKKRLGDCYWKGQNIESASLPILIDVYTDLANSDLYKTLLDVVAKDLPESVYVYKFTFEGNACTLKDKLSVLLEESVQGTFHADDFSYWTPIVLPGDEPHRIFSNETIQMIHTFTKMVTNFAKTGDPNIDEFKVHWDPSTTDKPCYMQIDNESRLIEGKLNGERMEFLENLKHELRKDY
ncbi:esterase E4-like isoform X2 [Planococcus citri]|uniref:esterase E4-like isoform X2 n=1 Tax=Planococcus citri TaxID=170843 RepID=UPI0031F876FD